MKKTLIIIFTIDESYIQHFTVTLISICENNKNINLNVFVIHDIRHMDFLNIAIRFFDEKYGLKISLLSLESTHFEHYNISLHVSKATYFRLMIADIIPSDIDRAVFLDSDIIVTGSLEELIELDLNNKYLLAANELNTDGLKLLNQIGLPATVYFNAGIMVLNLQAWRVDEVSHQLMLTAEKYMDKLKWWDQDVLNIYFFDKWGELSSNYNKRNIRKRLKKTPTIIHFSGFSKPWSYINNHPYKRLYWKYLYLSPFKNYKYQDLIIKNVIKRVVFFNKSL